MQRHAQHPLRYALLAFVAVLVCGSAPALAQDSGAAETTNTTCHSVSGEARYLAYGYNHVVTVTNTCDRPLRCLVWTNVDADKKELVVAPKSTGESVVRVGSPAQAFAAQGVCE